MEDYNNRDYDNPTPTPTTGTDPKVVSIVAYLTIVGTIVALVLNNPKTSLGSFHVRQALGIFLLGVVSRMAFIVPFVGWIGGFAGLLLTLVLWILGLISAIQSEQKQVPLLGDKFQEWFKSL